MRGREMKESANEANEGESAPLWYLWWEALLISEILIRRDANVVQSAIDRIPYRIFNPSEVSKR